MNANLQHCSVCNYRNSWSIIRTLIYFPKICLNGIQIWYDFCFTVLYTLLISGHGSSNYLLLDWIMIWSTSMWVLLLWTLVDIAAYNCTDLHSHGSMTPWHNHYVNMASWGKAEDLQYCIHTNIEELWPRACPLMLPWVSISCSFYYIQEQKIHGSL